jgi:uncharacterized protein DUF3179
MSILCALALSVAGCGGVREQIRAHDAPSSYRFDARELVDVLPPGRIPAIDVPTFSSGAKASADGLKAEEPVVVVALGEDARAYPLAILVWHEVVNDTVGGVPVAVTYAPLSNAAIVFDRRVAGRTESFAASGKLFRSNLVMVDRRTVSLWTQLDGHAVAGPSKGATLAVVPAQIASLAEFRAVFPGGSVLAAPKGSGRSYGFNPYAGYDSRTAPFGGFVALAPDRRLPSMDRIIGVSAGGEAEAFRYRRLRRDRVVAGRLGGNDVVVLWRSGTRSALDTADISEGRDVGSAGVFRPVAAGRHLDLTAASDGFRDRQTGSIWSVLGVATAGPLRGARLEPVPHADAFWFAWAAFHPETAS